MREKNMNQAQKQAFDELQARIDAQAQKDFGPEVVERWQNPPFMGRMKDCQAMACAAGSCGNSISIYLKFENRHIAEITFFSEGCGSSVVCASMLCELARGRNLEQALELGADDVMKALPGLPAAKKKYALLAVKALHQAALSLSGKENTDE